MGNKKMKYELLRSNGLFQNPISPSLALESTDLMEAWKKFCDQDLDHKKIYVKERFDDCGYVLTDKEESFTMSLGQKNFNDETMSGIDGIMLDRIKNTLSHLYESIVPIVDVFDVSSWFDLPKNLRETKRYWKLKFTKYFPAPYQTIISPSHVDNGITVLIIEDQPGLEILWKDRWELVSPSHEHVLIYPGLNIQYYSECEIPALNHRIISNSPDLCRNSINLFLDFSDIGYDRMRFGSTKKVFPDGLNYKMPFSKFKEYFYGAPPVTTLK